MSMVQKLHDMRAEFMRKTGQEPVTATLNYDEAFKLLEEVRDMTKSEKAYKAMIGVLLSRNEEDLVEIFKGSEFFGMTINIERVLHE